MPFVAGQSGNLKGRPRRVDLVKQEIKDLCAALFDQTYWRRIKRELRKGTLNPRLEITLLAYAFGPADREQTTSGVTVNVGFLNASPPLTHAPTVSVPLIDTATADLTSPSKIGLSQEPVLVPAQPVVPPADAG